MKDVFESTKSDLSETWKQNELLKDQLLEATLKHEIECCVLLSRECVDNNMKDEIEKVRRDTIEIQKGMQKQINILKNDTLPNKQQAVVTNENVIAPGMYKVGTSQDTNTNKAKSVLSSTGLSASSSVRRPSNRDSSFKNSVVSNTKNSSEKVEVSDRTNKKPDVTYKNVALNTFVTNDEIKNALIAKNVLCVTCAKYFVGTEYQLADLFTKALPKERFEYLVHRIVNIMAQPQRPADVHQDELSPLYKRCALMDANKKVNLENPLCPEESRCLENILQNHPLRFSIAASSSVPWIYLGQFWHTLQEDGSKYKLKFMLDKKDLTLTLNDFRTIFQLPQATNINHDHFVPALKFSEMVPFYVNNLGFTLKLRSTLNFKTTGLLQPWQTLCKMFSRCLTTRVTELLWEGYHYSLTNPITLIPYPIFTNLIVSHYMTTFPKISRRACDQYHNLADDVMTKIIFNSRKSKGVVRMKIPDWMITDEMKLTKNYWLYDEVFGADVPMTQSQLIESTQGTHRTTSAPRTPNPKIVEGESSAL
ncbi:hypothetical protein Tco_0366153 [Tanacetum coccineum]